MTNKSIAKPPRAWRRALRPRTWIVLIALLALPMAWLVSRSKTQRMAVEAIQQAGGRVQHDHDYAGRDLIGSDFARPLGGGPWGPEWLRRAIGDEPFQDVVEVDIPANPDLDNRVIEAMTRLRGLQMVDITLRNRYQLASLRPIHQLPGLWINGAKVGDDGLAFISEFKHLCYLSMNVADFGDAELGRIKDLKDLEYFHIGDEGMVVAGGFPRLRSLILSQSQITDVGLARLGDLANLTALVVGRTKVTPAGIAAIQARRPTLTVR